MTEAVQLAPGSLVGGDFTILAPLDEGGMGAVFIAEQASTGKRRALKLMHREIVADAGLTKRFEQEAKVGARIRSEHVVEVLAAGVDGSSGVPYLVMELLEGEDLRHRLKRSPGLTHDEVRVIYEQMCHAMAAAHASGVVHRDLKPENVFLAVSLRAGGAAFVVKVLDFGIAKIQAEAGTRATRGAVGSPMWMAPEQTAPGPVTPAADVWAMGLLAYELFTGRSFWRAANESDGTTAQLLREIVLDPIPSASERAKQQGFEHLLPVGFDAWFNRCVAREPLARFVDAGQLWRGMQGLFGGVAVITGSPRTVREAFEETADAAPFVATPAPLPPIPTLAGQHLPAATPLESARDVSRVVDSPPRASRWPIAVAAVVAAAGIGAGVWISRARPVPAAVALAPSAGPVVVSATPPTPPLPPAPASAEPVVVVPPKVVIAAPAVASSAPAVASSAPPKKAGGGGAGFVDPNGKPVTWKVQDRPVRLFTRLVSNDSNVLDATVRKAIEWEPWEYLLCYQKAFSDSKDMPEGVVTVGYEILDQLPRHAALISSTIESKTFNACVVGTLVGQTINAAGPDGKGHAVHAFRFVPN